MSDSVIVNDDENPYGKVRARKKSHMQSPILGNSFGGADEHKSKADIESRIAWLKENRLTIVASSGEEAYQAAREDADQELQAIEGNQSK